MLIEALRRAPEPREFRGRELRSRATERVHPRAPRLAPLVRDRHPERGPVPDPRGSPPPSKGPPARVWTRSGVSPTSGTGPGASLSASPSGERPPAKGGRTTVAYSSAGRSSTPLTRAAKGSPALPSTTRGRPRFPARASARAMSRLAYGVGARASSSPRSGKNESAAPAASVPARTRSATSRRHASQVRGASGAGGTPFKYTPTRGRGRSAELIANASTTAWSRRAGVEAGAVEAANVSRSTARSAAGERSGSRRRRASVPRFAAASCAAGVPALAPFGASPAGCTTVTVELRRPARLTRPRRCTIESSGARSITAWSASRSTPISPAEVMTR